MTNILVTGGNSQLAKCISDLSVNQTKFNIIYTDYLELDITKHIAVDSFFLNNKIDYCINCAAYTDVDKAESDKVGAINVNETGAKNLTKVCHKYNTTLIHISTDFVFDGKKNVAYKENDSTNPINIYGLSKLKGEQAITEHLDRYFIIRTSWLYSEHGNNFMKTMIRLSNNRSQISVVEDQIGTPTFASDLAAVILEFITSRTNQYGIYHYSNEGVASWYDFAKAIFDEKKCDIELIPITSEAYPTPAKRPHFSVLDKTKIKTSLNIKIPHWRDSLRTAIQNHNEQLS